MVGSIYKKVVLILKSQNVTSNLLTEEDKIDDDFSSRIKIEYDNSGFLITGNYVIINKLNEEEKTTTGIIHDIKDIHSYKLIN